ncbi:MAG: hypothetical protein ACPG6X_05065 [Synechococcus sp.]
MSLWSAASACGFQNSLPPRDRRRLLRETAIHARTLMDGHTVCRLRPF